MNYRHLYHAGNFADVLKHIVLLACLDYLQRKEGALAVIDSHSGSGLYDLRSEEAAKTGEWERGVGCLKQHPDAPSGIQTYLAAIESDLASGLYPGSPLLIARRLRANDRLVANELHEPAFEALSQTLSPFKTARTSRTDAYECIRAHIPPKERRGLVLIDPPFEAKDEFETLCRQMPQWKRRWATGVFLLWYPIKAHLPVEALKAAARQLALPRTWCVETLIAPRDQAVTFNGCGLLLFNAPYTVPERIEALLPFLKLALRLHDTQAAWEVPEL